MLMDSTQDALLKLAEIRLMGLKTAIDDFGTGYSSLAYLQRLPIDTLKIDRSFLSNIRAGTKCTDSDTAVIRAVTSLAQVLGMQVVAEGVETDVQREFLATLKCGAMQGYLFSPPVKVARAEDFLRNIGQPIKAAPKMKASA
jgi:diguanylate cyclase